MNTKAESRIHQRNSCYFLEKVATEESLLRTVLRFFFFFVFFLFFCSYLVLKSQFNLENNVPLGFHLQMNGVFHYVSINTPQRLCQFTKSYVKPQPPTPHFRHLHLYKPLYLLLLFFFHCKSHHMCLILRRI